MKKQSYITILLCLALLSAGCSNQQDTSSAAASSSSETAEGSGESSAAAETIIDTSDMFTDRDYEVGYDESTSALIQLNGNSAECSSDAVQISGSTVTITEEGTYILSGNLDDGMIIINAEKTDKLQLVLNNVSVNSSTSAAIYILQADKVFLTLASDSANTLSNGGQFTAIDDNNIDAVIFSKEDLTLNGSGALTIESPAGHGIVSKDDLVFTGGNYTIQAAKHGVSGKDSIRIADGSFTVSSEKDGLHADNSEDASQGFLYITGGTFDIDAQGDGISASAYLQIVNGEFHILSGGGSAAAATYQSSGFPEQTSGSDEEDSTSMKGIKAGGDLILDNGTFTIDSADDTLHSNANMTVNGGEYQLSTGDDGLHADARLVITAGTINITESYEGIEGLSIDISGGEIRLIASDDGLNAAGGADQSGTRGFGRNDSFASDSNMYINITGGTLFIDASGDGIDSNGNLSVSGGEIYISGPTSGGDGALDYDGEAEITGGIIIAAGSAQMAQNFGSSSTQGSMLVSVGSQPAGSHIELTDSNGQVLVSWTSEKTFESLVISCPEIVLGSVYTLTAGSYTTEITMDTIIYGGTGGMNGPGGGGGTGRGNRP